eukprot:GEMP01009483.1.p1 GENE.GEMP01009483.1~~GEMP01009483.1.p1  ORF type:complete len:445 (+),score=86.37 GEMP01009483.1:211-1545(+)
MSRDGKIERMSTFGSESELLESASESMESFKTKVQSILSAFFEASDLEACVGDIVTLDCKAYDDELFVLAVQKTLDSRAAEAANLLRSFIMAYYGPYEKPCTSMIRGIEMLLTTWEDLMVDVPNVLPFLIELMFFAMENKFLGEDFLHKIPEKLVKSLAEGELRTTIEGGLEYLGEFKQKSKAVLEEYFDGPSVDEIRIFLETEKVNCYHHEFVRIALIDCLRRRTEPDQDILKAVTLLSELKEQVVLSSDECEWGFLRFLGSLNDLAIDCPKYEPFAADLTGQLLTNNVISSLVVNRCRQLEVGGAAGATLLGRVRRDLPEFYRKSVRGYDFKREVRLLITEFFDSGDKTEAKRILQEFSMTHAMRAEFVRKLVYFAMERSMLDGERAMMLLSFLKKHEELTAEDIRDGFCQLEEMIPELELDLPHVKNQFQTLVNEYPLLVE